MIKSIRIKNFQSHLDTKIELSSSVSVFRGSSDAGKSAIIRSLKWAFFNTPSGNDFITRGKKNCTVHVEFDDGLLTRNKGGTNEYIINGIQFKRFGTNVPDEVKEFHNCDKLNIHSQSDPLFLISDTAGDMAKTLNAIVNLEAIDDSLSHINSSIRNKGVVTANEKKKIIQIQSDLDEYIYLEDMKDLEHKLKSDNKEFNKLGGILEDIEDMLDFKRLYDLKVSDLKGSKEKRTIVSRIRLKAELKDTLDNTIDNINNLIDSYREIKQEIKTQNMEKNLLLNEKSSVRTCPTCKSFLGEINV